jgi:hypothetical protein
MSDERPTFQRLGNLVLFNQYGPKLAFPNDVENTTYFNWLDNITADIGMLVPGSLIREKANDRSDPRRNTGVYYDTADYRLLHGHMVLRTTSNPKTHAFCAFKYGADDNEIRRDHRYVFDGEEKAIIQADPTSDAAVRTVHQLLARRDIRHPGTFLAEDTGITSDDLTPALKIAQYRYTFYVLLESRDVLRCSLDRAEVANLRQPESACDTGRFSEVELPIYPRIAQEVQHDPRTQQLIDLLANSLIERFNVEFVRDAKYRRAARVLGLLV